MAKACCQIIRNGFNEYYTAEKAQLRYKRQEHAICALDKYLIVTGSFFVDLDESYRRVEMYDLSRDQWEVLSPLNEGRALHAQCPFNERFIFVFCGESMPRGGLSRSIERLDLQKLQNGWLTVNIKEQSNDLKRARQIPAVT